MAAKYPLSKTKFQVEISGLETVTGWVRVQGIAYGIQTTPIFTQHTQNPTFLPGKRHAGPIVLTRMFDDNPQLAEWAAKGAEDPRNGSVIFIDYAGQETRRFNFEGAYVSGYKLSDFDSRDQSEGTAEETITLTVENIRPG